MSEFDAIYGYADAKQELEQIADVLKHPEHYESFGATMPSGLLIEGAPGTGKTLMANCLIAESGLPSFVCRKDRTGNDMLTHIRETFDRALEEAPSIILLDDMDKFSNNPYSLRNTDEFVTLQACIDGCRGSDVFVIATVNDAERLPDSLVREGRFDRVIKVEPPLGADAFQIIEHYLSGRAVPFATSTQDIVGIMEGHSCAFLETVINEASLAAGYELADSIRLEHLVQAYIRIESKGGLLAPGSSDDGSLVSGSEPSQRAITAFHEAGHVVAAEALKPGSVSIAFICRQHGRLSGVTKRGGREIVPETYDDLWSNLLIILAGSVAVEQRFGVPCLGAGHDNEDAVDLLKRLLRDTAMSGSYYTTISPLRIDSPSEVRDATDHVCGVELDHARREVRALQARYAAQVADIAAILYERGYVLADDIAATMRAAA